MRNSDFFFFGKFRYLSSLQTLQIYSISPLMSLPSSSSSPQFVIRLPRGPLLDFYSKRSWGASTCGTLPTQVWMWAMETAPSPSTHQPLAFSSPAPPPPPSSSFFASSATSLQHSSSLILLHHLRSCFFPPLGAPGWTRLWFLVSPTAAHFPTWSLQPETDLFSNDWLGLELIINPLLFYIFLWYFLGLWGTNVS